MRGKALESLRLVIVERPEVVYDFDLDRDIRERFAPGTGDGKTGPLRLPRECLVTVNHGKLLLKNNEHSLQISDFSFDGEIRDDRISLDGNWHTQASLAGLAGALESVSVDGNIQGNFAQDLSGGEVLLTVSAIRGTTFELRDLQFDLSIGENLITLRNSQDELLELRFDYDLDTGALSGMFNPAGFVPSDSIRFLGNWENLNRWLTFNMAGNSFFSLEPSGKLQYEFDLSGGGSPLLRNFVLTGEGTEAELSLRNSSVDLRDGSISYRGDLLFDPLLPNGILSFSNFSILETPLRGIDGMEGIDGSIYFNPTGRKLDVFAEDFSMGGVVISAITGGLVWEDEGCTYGIEFLRFRNMESYEDVELSTLSLEGSFENSGQLQGTIALEAFSMGDLQNMVRPLINFEKLPQLVEDLSSHLIVSTEVFISTDFKNISYSAPFFTAAYDDRPNSFGTASLAGTDRRFEISGGRINWKNGSIDVGLSADFSVPNDINFMFQAAYRDFVYSFDGVFFDRRTLSIQGSYGLSASISAGENGDYSGYLDVGSMPVPLGGETALLTIDTSLRYDDPSSWRMNIDTLELKTADAAVYPFADFRIAGEANQDGLDLGLISYSDNLGTLRGSASAEWNYDFSALSGFFTVEDPGAAERCAVELSFAEGLAEFSVDLERIQLDRFFGGGRNLLASAELLGSWSSPSSYSINLNLQSLESVSQNIFASASGYVDAENVIVSSLKANYGEMNVDIPTFTLDRTASKLMTEGVIEGSVKGHPLGLSLAVDAAFEPIDSWFGFNRAFRSFYAVFDVRDGYIKSRHYDEPYSFILSRGRSQNRGEGMAVRLEGGPRDMIRFEWLENGNFFAGLSAPSPVQATITGTLVGTEINASAKDVYIDMPMLWDLIPSEGAVQMTGGFITGETKITGSILDPEFSGLAWGSGIRLTIPHILSGEVGPGSAEIILAGSEISFGPLDAPCGEGMGVISAVLRFNRWVPSFDIAIKVEQEDYIPFDFDLAGVKAEGNVAGNLDLHMENNEVLTITGNIGVSDTEIALNSDEIDRLTESGFASEGSLDIVTDIHISAGRRVEFLWPSADFPIIQAYGDAGSGIQVMGDTRIPQFTLAGDLTLRGGEIFYYQRNFYIREGQIQFNGNDTQIDPRISVRAEIRDQNDDGPVTIAMIIDNAPIRSFMPRFESNPALSQLEIYSLLGQNPTGAIAGGQSSDVLLRSVTDVLAQFTLVRQTERRIRNILGLDMFSVRTQALQNAVFQILGTQDPVQQNRSMMGNFFDNTTVFMGKYLGADLFFQAMLSLRYDESGGYGNSRLRLEPDIGLDFRTPLGNIQWNLSPRHPENMFVNDQSISLVWRWVF
jgi:hypothetical protein